MADALRNYSRCVLIPYKREEGGYRHCQIDNQSTCSAFMWDWLEQVLEPAS